MHRSMRGFVLVNRGGVFPRAYCPLSGPLGPVGHTCGGTCKLKRSHYDENAVGGGLR